MRSIPVLAIALLAVTPAPAWSENRPLEPPRPEPSEGKAMPQAQGEGVADLPWARGRVFYSLDEYFAHLQRQGEIDLPWWREVAPGIYEQVGIRVPGQPPERATREELMRRYGFRR